MRRIADGVFQLEEIRGARVCLLVGEEGLLLVDAGVPGQARAIVDELRKAGHDPADVRAIVVTHCHSDHIGSLDELARQCDAEVWAHADEASFIDGSSELPFRSRIQRVLFGIEERLLRHTPRKVDRTLADGEEVDGPVPFIVVGLPGHTPGSIALHMPDRRLAVVGDALFGGIPFKGPLAFPPTITCVDADEAKRSSAKLAALDLETICQGHGDPVLRGAADVVRKLL